MQTKNKNQESIAVIHLPAPTPWPMILALGITLGVAGLLTHEVAFYWASWPPWDGSARSCRMSITRRCLRRFRP